MFKNKYFLCVAALLIVAIAGTTIYAAMQYTPEFTRLMPGAVLQNVGLSVGAIKTDRSNESTSDVSSDESELKESIDSVGVTGNDQVSKSGALNENSANGTVTSNNNASDSAAHLGLYVKTLHPALAAHVPELEEQKSGVIVDKVIKGAPAHVAGIKRHDIITQFNDQPVESPRQLAELVRESKPGDEVKLDYIRKGASYSVDVTLKEADQKWNPMAAYPAWFPPLKPFDFDDEFFQFEPSDMASVDLDPTDNETSWSEFQSMKMTRNSEGEYRIDVDYRKNGDSIERTYEGSRDEILKAIQEDSELPESIRKRVKGSLTDEPRRPNDVAEKFFKDFQRPAFAKDWLDDRDWFQNQFKSWPLFMDWPGIDRSNENASAEQGMGL